MSIADRREGARGKEGVKRLTAQVTIPYPRSYTHARPTGTLVAPHTRSKVDPEQLVSSEDSQYCVTLPAGPARSEILSGL